MEAMFTRFADIVQKSTEQQAIAQKELAANMSTQLTGLEQQMTQALQTSVAQL